MARAARPCCHVPAAPWTTASASDAPWEPAWDRREQQHRELTCHEVCTAGQLHIAALSGLRHWECQLVGVVRESRGEKTRLEGFEGFWPLLAAGSVALAASDIPFH